MRTGVVMCLILLVFTSSYSQDIFELVKEGDLKKIKKYKGDINLQDENKATPLMWAIYEGNAKTVKKLLGKGADPYLKGWIHFIDSNRMSEFMYGSCLAIAAGENNSEILELLIEKEVVEINDREINLYENKENGWTALHWATVKGNYSVMRYLLENGADINAEAYSDANQSPLHFAIRFGDFKAAKLLVENGCDVNKKDKFDNSPLMYAFHFKNKNVVNLLLKKGAETGVPNLKIDELMQEYFGIEYSE